MNKQILYRAANPVDAAAMVKVHFNAVQAVSTAFYSQEIRLAWSPVPSQKRIEWLAGVITNIDTNCCVATNQAGQIMAFVIYLVTEQIIQALYVEPGYTGMGIGATLMTMVEKSAVLKGADRVALKASMNAVSFYQAMGFVVVKQGQQELSDGSVMSAMVMEKNLLESNQ